MALVKCTECGKDVSTAATSCPHCGAPRPSAAKTVAKAASGVWTAVKLLIGLVFFFIVFQCTQSSGLGDPPSGLVGSDSPAASTATAAAPESPPGWVYDKVTDPMTSKITSVAHLRSVNSMTLGSPYAGQNYGHLMVRTTPKGATEAAFYIDKGQTMCRSYEYGCRVTVRFDDAQPTVIRGIAPTDNSTEWAFLESPGKLIAGAKKAKRLRVSMDIYKNGTQVLEFTPPAPLEWPPK